MRTQRMNLSSDNEELPGPLDPAKKSFIFINTSTSIIYGNHMLASDASKHAFHPQNALKTPRNSNPKPKNNTNDSPSGNTQ